MDTTITRPTPVARPFAPTGGKAALTAHAAAVHFDKRKATARAQAALAGAVLIDTEDDHGRTVFILTRRAVTRRFDDLSELEAFLHGEVVEG